MPTRKPIYRTVNEGTNNALRFTTDADLSGQTLTAYAKLADDTGTVVTLGTANGQPANVETDIELATVLLSINEWVLEVWAEIGTANQKLIVPDAGQVFILDIQQRAGV